MTRADYFIIGLLCWVLADVAPNSAFHAVSEAYLTHVVWNILGTISIIIGLYKRDK